MFSGARRYRFAAFVAAFVCLMAAACTSTGARLPAGAPRSIDVHGRAIELVQTIAMNLPAPLESSADDAPPSVSLDGPPESPSSDHLVEADPRWWVSALSPRAALQRYAHGSFVIAGVHVTGSGGFGTYGPVGAAAVTYTRLSAPDQPYAIDIAIYFSATSINGETTIRGDVQAVWTRDTSSEILVKAPTGALVRLDRGFATFSRRLDQHESERVANLINALPAYPPVATSCPNSLSPADRYIDKVVFATERGRVVATFTNGGCPFGGTVTGAGAHASRLDRTRSLNTLLVQLFKQLAAASAAVSLKVVRLRRHGHRQDRTMSVTVLCLPDRTALRSAGEEVIHDDVQRADPLLLA